MQVELLIDGYNLLHAAGFARPNYGPGGLLRARLRLLQKLSELLDPQVQARTTVVWDARRDPPSDSPAAPPSSGGIRVLFTVDRREADDLIEDLLAGHSAPKQVLVVSSDHRLHQAARRRGAAAIDSEQFLSDLERPPETTRPGASPAKPAGTPELGDLAEEIAAAAQLELERLASEPSDGSRPAAGERSPLSTNAGDRKLPPTPAPPADIDDPDFWLERIEDERRPDRPPPRRPT
ncbi:MAG: NYN domain-containing protein [Planctomyces sp.]|nr:NYN domain-containing protein [Planctomyces sp.]